MESLILAGNALFLALGSLLVEDFSDTEYQSDHLFENLMARHEIASTPVVANG